MLGVSETVSTRLLLISLLIVASASCGVRRTTGGEQEGADRRTIVLRSVPLDTVDVLVVVDNSESMGWAQSRLPPDFVYGLLDTLSKLGASRPDLRIGVVSTDVGTAPYVASGNCDTSGGDDGRLQRAPGLPRWLSLSPLDQTNVDPEGPVAACAWHDARRCLAEAFKLQASLGTRGCGYEMPFEAAWRALDPGRGTNPGFLREEALLLVLFVTDEDDCSVARPELLDPARGRETALGPLTSFRCFAHGIECEDAAGASVNPYSVGPRFACRPGGDYLRSIEHYVEAFARLKRSAGRVLMAALAGPPAPVVVGRTRDDLPWLDASCRRGRASAAPAIRVEALSQAFGGAVHSICADDYLAPSRHLGTRLAAAASQRCLPGVLRREGGAPACQAAADVDCRAWLRAGAKGDRIPLRRCSPALFASHDDDPCATEGGCPCWRLVERPATCGPKVGLAPYGLELLGVTTDHETIVELDCAMAPRGAC